MAKSAEVVQAEMLKDLEYIKKAVDDIKKRQESEFVTHDEFAPIKKLVYGAVGTSLSMLLAALIGLVVVAR